MKYSRVLKLNTNAEISDAKSVIYVMSRDQRVQDNHALIEAQKKALELKVPLVVVFNLMKKSGVRSREHFQFMIDGLKHVEKELQALNISLVLTIGDGAKNIPTIAQKLFAQTVYFDFNPLTGVRNMQKTIAKQVTSAVYVVDTHNTIPVWVTSNKEEYAAHTIRNKIHKHLFKWVKKPDQITRHPYSLQEQPNTATWKEVDSVIQNIPRCGITLSWKSGETAALNHLDRFIENKLSSYASQRNNPALDGQSDLSPYLHFGQISSLRVVLELLKVAQEDLLLFQKGKLISYEGEPTVMDSINVLVEEMIVRKELADNFCFYNPNYTSLEGAKDWAHQTLAAHKTDPREYTYSKDQWEQAQTHDSSWNAAQKQLLKTGKIHGYMRMYWAKKILEWSASPEEALETAIYLNDHYSIDGGDPNGYVGILWSIAGVHDRPWFERPVFGKIRYMNSGGLKRKFDLDTYISTWL